MGLNLIAVLTIPLNLGWLLGQSVQIDAMGLLFKLVALVLVPALVGHGLGRAWPRGVASLAGVLKYVPVVGIATLVYMSVSANNEALLAMKPEVFLVLLAAALSAHCCFWSSATPWPGGPWACRRARPALWPSSARKRPCPWPLPCGPWPWPISTPCR